MNRRSEVLSFDNSRGQEVYRPAQQLLVMMLGVPGAGKSRFARQAAEALGFERFSSDAIRTELFGRPDVHLVTETGERTPPEVVKGLNKKVFKVLNQRVEEALLSGRSVIRDHIHARSHREGLCSRQAGLVGALPIVVLMETPLDLAHERGMAREPRIDQINETDPGALRERIDYWHQAMDLPSGEEICIKVDSRWDFVEQLKHFVSACRQAERELRAGSA